jgi:hypothetical protein
MLALASRRTTRAEITRIEDSINRYNDDFESFPGPFANDDIANFQMNDPGR